MSNVSQHRLRWVHCHKRHCWASARAKVADVVGLYLNPPQNALVISIDE